MAGQIRRKVAAPQQVPKAWTLTRAGWYILEQILRPRFAAEPETTVGSGSAVTPSGPSANIHSTEGGQGHVLGAGLPGTT